MKKTILTIAMLIGLSASYATTNFETVPNSISNELTINKIKKGSRLTVKNSNGGVVYSEIISKTASLQQNFDFTNLKDGLYTVEVIYDFEVKTQKMVVNAHKVTFLEDTTSIFYKPLIRTNNHKIYVSKLVLKDAEIKVKIYFEGDEIFNETTKDSPVFERIYSLDTTNKGRYSVVLSADGRDYTSSFNL